MSLTTDIYDKLNDVRRELHAFLKKEKSCTLIWANPHTPTPPKPYGVFNMTARVVDYRDAIETSEQLNRYQHRQIKQTVSLTFRGRNKDMLREANDIAEHARRWLSLWGEPVLTRNNLVVETIGQISDRTTFIVDSYDYKVGFDVTFRTMQVDNYRKLYQDDKTKENYDIIETVVVNDRQYSKEDDYE